MEQGNLPGKENEKAVNDRSLEEEKISGGNEPDTEPDEFISPNADTDQPLEGKGIVNDAVLGGEDHPVNDKDIKRKGKKQ